MIDSLFSSSHAEPPKIKKGTTLLTNPHYQTPRTSLLTFHFEPHPFASSEIRMRNSSIHYVSIEGKELYLLDAFFLPQEGQEMRTFSQQATFSRDSYGSPEAIARGEKPARSMNGKERWHFFSHPPHALSEVYKLFGMLAHALDADVATLPWELCDQALHGSPSVIANRIEEASYESMELGKHRDCHPEKGIAFGIPLLYSQHKEWHPAQFVNGAKGRPWLISVMLYSTAENFLPEYRMGTAFYQEDGKLVLRSDCLNMRLVLFEGDLFHSIEESKIPSDVKSWRVSYVFKLLLNPRHENQSLKHAFFEYIRTLPAQCKEVSLDQAHA